MFMQVFIERRRRLHHEESCVKYFHENSSFWSFSGRIPEAFFNHPPSGEEDEVCEV